MERNPLTCRELTSSDILVSYLLMGGDIEQKPIRAKAPKGDFGHGWNYEHTLPQGVLSAIMAALLGVELKTTSYISILGSGIRLM